MTDNRSMWERHDLDEYEKVTGSDNFPWGECEPPGGFRVGDYVGLIYADHEEYVFDNPTGFVTSVENDGEDWTSVTVEVQATIGADRVFLIAREKELRK